MFSRAHLLIERDYQRLLKDKLWGVEAHPLTDDNLFEWTAKVKGFQGTIWEGGVFRLYIKFDENYNVRPPDVCFHTIPFHPNVDMITGRPCIDFLDDYSYWKESYSLSYILLSIQTMLCNPVLDNAINTEAVELILYSPHAYKQMVLDCVVASQRLAAGVSPHILEEDKVRFIHPKQENLQQEPPRTAQTKSIKLSFEDYHSTWSGIATSRYKHDVKNPLLENIKDKPNLQIAHYGLNIQELQQQMTKQLHEHNALMYGNIRTKPNEAESKQAKLDMVNKMRKIYLPPRKTPIPVPSPAPNSLSGDAVAEPWEEEVDGLVAWTTKLDEDMI